MSPNKEFAGVFLVSLSALAPQLVRADVVPKVFIALEETAEDITESAAAPARLKTAIATLKLEQPKALAELARVGASAEMRAGLSHTLNDLYRAAEMADRNATARLATDVLLSVADAIDSFKPVRPGDLLRLDALAMRIPLDLSAQKPAEATQHAERLAEVWQRLRPRVSETARVARDEFSVEVANLLKAVARGHAKSTMARARAIEKLVDELEDTFPAW